MNLASIFGLSILPTEMGFLPYTTAKHGMLFYVFLFGATLMQNSRGSHHQIRTFPTHGRGCNSPANDQFRPQKPMLQKVSA